MVNSTQHGRLAVSGSLAVKNEHTFLVCHAQHRVAQGLLQIVSLVLVITGNFLNKSLPPRALSVLQSVIEIGLHGQKVVPVMLPELHFLKIIGSVQAVNEKGVCVKLSGSDRHNTGSVFHEPVTETPVTHLRNELHVLSTAVFVINLSAIKSHQAAKFLDLLSYQ